MCEGAEKFQSDPHWRDHLLFYEYFHGDNGAGLGASHQTGWTGLVAMAIQLFGLLEAKHFLERGHEALYSPQCGVEMSGATDLRRQTSCERAEQAGAQLRQVVGFSVADAIEKLERLKNSGSISAEEFTRLCQVYVFSASKGCIVGRRCTGIRRSITRQFSLRLFNLTTPAPVIGAFQSQPKDRSYQPKMHAYTVTRF